jgi:octanoyl-[GcvH]:protein N-octanoyltransferase
MILHRGAAGSGHPASDIALAHALLIEAGQVPGTAALRVYQPNRPAVVFGRRDTRLPGFAAAVEAAHEAGFETAVRAVGGRAVAYTQAAVVADLVGHEPAAIQRQDWRFRTYGDRLADALGTLGIDARVGAVPGEYCPGAHSINARGVSKLLGTAQRVIRHSWLLSVLAVVGDQERCARVLGEVYSKLEQPFDPESVGAIQSENDSLTCEDVQDALIGALGVGPTAEPEPLSARTRALAAAHLVDHRVA